jgi:hypothetical protein
MPGILATKEAEIGRITVRGQPGYKILETPSQPMTGHGSTCLSSQLHREAQLGDHGPDRPGHNARHYLKNNQHKKY